MALFMTIFAINLTSCDSESDSPKIEGDGVTEPSWTDTYSAAKAGEDVTFTFNAAADWTASTGDSWIKVLTTSGKKGSSEIKISVSPNTDDETRLASVIIAVAGYQSKYTLKIRQGVEGRPANLSEANKFIYDYMAEYYLWNEGIPQLKLNGTASYDRFFQSILTGIDGLDHMNRDDGHWENGRRENFYSYVERESASKSRAFGEEETGSGVTFCIGKYITPDNSVAALVPMAVVPGSPAAEKGIKRGSLITKVAGSAVTGNNANDLYTKLVAGNCTIETVTVNYDESGYYSSLSDPVSVTIGSATFEDPSIYEAKVASTTSGKKIGYLCYMYFDYAYDNQLIDIFSQFKQLQIDELVLDLRYNGGGHVIASTVLGTLIAGQSHKDQIYNRTTYNAARNAKGESGEYRIGNPKIPDGNGTYDKISKALESSVGLNRIYVLTSVNTASASELIINGLRGLDIDVRLIGTTTNGKNVGMESIMSRNIGGYYYTVTPITFYSQNAKGFRDFSDGFTPDIEIEENYWPIGDWGTTADPLYYLAFEWIYTDSKPNLSLSRSMSQQTRQINLPENRNRKLTKREGAIILHDITEL